MDNFGNFWSVLQRKTLVNFMAILSILWPFGIYILWPFGINFMAILSILLPFRYILWPFGIFCGHFGICRFPVLIS
jgi:hypothetical protein